MRKPLIKHFWPVFALIVSLTLLTATAWAANITGYFRAIGPGQRVYGDLDGHSDNPWAGTLKSEIDGKIVGTFCTDLEHTIHYN